MKKYIIASALACVTCVMCTSPTTSVIWTEGAVNPESGMAVNTITITNAPKGNDWCIWFAANHIDPVMQEGSQGSIERFNGCMYRILPSESRKGRDLTVVYASKPIPRRCWAPEGFSLQKGGRKVQLEASYNYLAAERLPDFDFEPVALGVEDMIPALKRYVPADGFTQIAGGACPEVSFVEGKPAGWYRITLDGTVHLEASDEDGAYYASVTLDNMRRNAGGDSLPNAQIEDWPDLQYRGFMLDVSRNFTDKEGILKLIDVLAHYKVNVLHLHLGDDEGWRLEIEDIPELTRFGARHCLPDCDANGVYSENEGLIPSYSGKIDPDDPANSGNGYYSHEDYVEILRYAWARRMRVLPEFDSPGHARAALRSLEKYALRTLDDSFLMSEASDTSSYLSVQYYTDNAINVALPSTYTFFAKVFDTLVEYYREAGAPLEMVHIGGDEVPSGAWMGSPACRELMSANGWTDSRQLKSWFVEQLAGLLRERGLKMAGWQEVVTGITPECLERIKGDLGAVNFWNTRTRGDCDQLPYRYANGGVPVVLSNMTNTYLDFAYNAGKLERGHSWGGFVDERRSFCLLPYDIYRSVRWDDKGRIKDISGCPEGKTELLRKENIIGVQGQLWSETIRSFDQVTYYVFPKSVGLFERGWNASPAFESTLQSDCPEFTDAFNRFYSIVCFREMPFYDSLGINYRKR